MRPATLKYFTDGSSGVVGLNSSFRYLDVRLAYAGKSRTERINVVNDDGNDRRDWGSNASTFESLGFSDVHSLVESAFLDPSFPSPRYS